MPKNDTQNTPEKTQEKGSLFTPKRIILDIVYLFLLSFLLLMVLLAVIKKQIPPFYGWLEDTQIENTGLYILGRLREEQIQWHRKWRNKPLSESEIETKKTFSEQIKSLRPTHAVLLEDGRSFTGILKEQDENFYHFTYHTNSKIVSFNLKDSDIKWKKKFVYPPIELSPRDVRFLINYSEYELRYMPPYIIVSSAPFQEVDFCFIILSALEEDFRKTFNPLFNQEQETHNLHICLLKDQKEYLSKTKGEYNLTFSAGYYSHFDDCLYAYDRTKSLEKKKLDKDVEKFINKKSEIDAILHCISSELKKQYKDIIEKKLHRETVTIIRHEGAHQLAFNMGVHSLKGNEHLWLIEGLAQYCETIPIGALDPKKIKLLQDNLKEKNLIDWYTLVNTKTPQGFRYYEKKAPLAYAQSWFLFRYLLQNNKAEFLYFMDFLKNLPSENIKKSQIRILEENCSINFVELIKHLHKEIQTIL
ncbi:MAG: DUF1570 domain-containing protein [Verrucomicrobiota bacterium]|nr:DUF1570 domain-containing protein [Verrucomicrobiota bacterium]